MKFLIDNALSIRVAEQLRTAGHDVVHVRDVGLAAASDDDLLTRARNDGRIIVSVDTDFGTLLARTNTSHPSFILLRWPGLRHSSDQVRVISANLPAVQADLVSGAVVVIEPSRVRVRTLPINRQD